MNLDPKRVAIRRELMRNDGTEFAYEGSAPCGCVVDVATYDPIESPGYLKAADEHLMNMARRGLAIARVPLEYADAVICTHLKSKPGQPRLLDAEDD